MIYVWSDADFGAIEFENYFKGKPVSEIIQRFFDGDEEYDGDFEMELMEFKGIDPDFIQFVRNGVQDYDGSKHSNFYFEGQTI